MIPKKMMAFQSWPAQGRLTWSNTPAKFPYLVRLIQFLAAVLVLRILLTIPFHSTWTSEFSNPMGRFQRNAQISAVYNDTLGFERFYGIVMPGRHDRRDALLSAASATNLSLTIVDGIADQDVVEDDIPKNWKPENGHWRGQIGCLVAHVNLWKRMIQENISTALIIESDADWDMRLKRSAHGFSEGVRTILDFPFQPNIHQIGSMQDPPPRHARDFRDELKRNPYGDGWDLLYIGSCGAQLANDARVYAYNDSAAPSQSQTGGLRGPDEKEYPRSGGTRLVFQPDSAGCTVGYAISNKGARHLLDNYLRETNLAVDMAMQGACKHTDTTCVAVYPSIFAQADSQSNMATEPISKEEEDIKAGHGIQISARVNGISGLAEQGPPAWRKEWDF